MQYLPFFCSIENCHYFYCIPGTSVFVGADAHIGPPCRLPISFAGLHKPKRRGLSAPPGWSAAAAAAAVPIIAALAIVSIAAAVVGLPDQKDPAPGPHAAGTNDLKLGHLHIGHCPAGITGSEEHRHRSFRGK